MCDYIHVMSLQYENMNTPERLLETSFLHQTIEENLHLKN
jgi:hypothetical protein